MAHEFIIDLRGFKAKSNNAIGEEDVAKRVRCIAHHSVVNRMCVLEAP